MQGEVHQQMCHLIDKSLAGAASLEEQRSLRDHLEACGQCGAYLDASHRVIASLGGYSFEVDPGLQEKVLASLTQQLEAKPMPAWRSRLLALVLTVVGSLAAFRLPAVAAPVLHMGPEPLQLGLIAFWIAPSVCLCLLFFFFPLHRWMTRKGLSL